MGSGSVTVAYPIQPCSKGSRFGNYFFILPNDHAIDRVRAVQRGVDGFISYPYSLSNLRQNIQTIRRDLAIHFPPFFPHFLSTNPAT